MDKIETRTVPTENDRKKKYLRSYRDHVRRINRIDAEIAELRTMKLHPSVKSGDGMPHGSGGQNDLSGYAADLDSMIRELAAEKRLRFKAYHQVVRQINKLPSESEKDVLFYRYIKGLEWYEIAEKLRFSERQIFRIHGKALVRFEIPKDVSECQSNM